MYQKKKNFHSDILGKRHTDARKQLILSELCFNYIQLDSKQH